MIRLLNKTLNESFIETAEQHQHLCPVVTAETAGTTGVDYIDDCLHIYTPVVN